MRSVCIIVLTIFVGVLSAASGNAQDWQKIVPLKSKCEDIKRVFRVDGCSFPVSDYSLGKITLNVEFSTPNNRRRVPSGRVVAVIIIFNDLIPLEKIGLDLREFKIRPVEDMPNARTYVNEKKGIELTVQRVTANEDYVSSVSLRPPRSRER